MCVCVCVCVCVLILLLQQSSALYNTDWNNIWGVEYLNWLRVEGAGGGWGGRLKESFRSE